MEMCKTCKWSDKLSENTILCDKDWTEHDKHESCTNYVKGSNE